MSSETSTTIRPKVALITGAAGGLGRGLVRQFLAAQWNVAAGCHLSQPFDPAENLMPFCMDVSDRSQVDPAVEQIIQRWGRIDVLINNAGVTADRLIAQTKEDDWDKVIRVNLKGAFVSSQSVLRFMAVQGGGHIINISSFAARRGTAGQACYAAAKAGLLGLTTSLAVEVGHQNIRVNAVMPGVLRTPMTAALSESQLAAFAESNALKRLNSIEEAAHFIEFLAGTENISGQLFQLDSRISRW